ncbi:MULTISPECIES: hypothetical protein [Burkholderiaceae]|uniref:hypothetical protein n=1 Tax=Burkholderiaceae TaxID=119060 RepID=UPI000DB66682|nr:MULTISPECIES: hypothetical protein [Burkholderiaceae]PZR41188.1 MAG: hypothetical protein DI523_33730 [Paraburkholderia fungorum]
MNRRDTKPDLHALLYIEQGQGVTELVSEIPRSVVSATGYEFTGAIELRAFLNREHATAFGHRVVLNSVGPELTELRAAVRKMERMQERMRKMEKELGEASTFAEYARRGMRAAGVGIVHVARDAAGRPRNASNYITVRADDGGSVLDAVGRLETIALMLFARRVEAA